MNCHRCGAEIEPWGTEWCSSRGAVVTAFCYNSSVEGDFFQRHAPLELMSIKEAIADLQMIEADLR